MEVRSLKVGYSRKFGRSNYGNEGASIELSVDLADGEDPVPAILAAGQLARRHALQLLADDGLDSTPATTPPPPASPPPTAAARPQFRSLPSGNSGSTRRGDPSGGHNGWPHTGRELCAWVAKQEEQGEAGLMKQIKAWGRDHGQGWKLTDWPADAVEQLVAELRALTPATPY